MKYNIDNFDNRTTSNWNFKQFCEKLDVYDSPEDIPMILANPQTVNYK